MNGKILFCDQAKTLMMISIIATHSMIFYSGNWFTAFTPEKSAPILAYGADYLVSFGIFVFTFVSGYIFQYLKFERGKYKIFGDFIKKKALRLLIPYLFVSAIWCVPVRIYFFGSDAWEIVSKFILGYNPAQLWYLLMLFVLFALIFPVANKIQSLKTSQAYFLAFVVYMFGMSLYMISIPFQLPAAFVHMAFFITGMVFRKNKVAIGGWNKFFILYSILFSICYYLDSETATKIKVLRYTLMFFVHMSGILMVVSLIQKYQSANFWNSSVYRFFKENSLTMYLFHQQIIYFMISVLNGVVEPPILAAINFVTAISVTSMICIVLNRFKVTRFLIGK